MAPILAQGSSVRVQGRACKAERARGILGAPTSAASHRRAAASGAANAAVTTTDSDSESSSDHPPGIPFTFLSRRQEQRAEGAFREHRRTAAVNRLPIGADDYIALLRSLRNARPDRVTTTLLAARVTDAGVVLLHIRVLFGHQGPEAERAGGPAGHHYRITVAIDPAQVDLRAVTDAWAAADS